MSVGGDPVDGSGSGPDRLVAARMRWRAAEDRLYPQLMADPDAYQRVISVVSAVLSELRRRTATAEELLAVEAQPAEILAAATVDRAAAAGIGDEVLLRAACSLRSRELAAATGSETERG
ncbi:MAG: hypothetical protein GEV09_00845 [Pseudonocardiaceae bacterium]|nr:hypothetical protein [Pseudonocardiaceae bacterium]